LPHSRSVRSLGYGFRAFMPQMVTRLNQGEKTSF
jgi:hypothetical protein